MMITNNQWCSWKKVSQQEICNYCVFKKYGISSCDEQTQDDHCFCRRRLGISRFVHFARPRPRLILFVTSSYISLPETLEFLTFLFWDLYIQLSWSIERTFLSSRLFSYSYQYHLRFITSTYWISTMLYCNWTNQIENL